MVWVSQEYYNMTENKIWKINVKLLESYIIVYIEYMGDSCK